MTKRESVEILEFNAGLADPELKDALNLAISALKFKENYDKFWEEVKSAGMRGEEVEIHHSGRVFRIREVAQ